MQKNLCQKSFSKYYFFIVYIIINIYSFETNALPLKTKILNLKEEKVVLKILIAKANPAVLEPTDKKATTGVGDPS